MRTKTVFLYFFTLLFLGSCHTKKHADLLLYNGVIYTVDSVFTVAEAMVVNDGKILATGTSEELMQQFDADGKTDLGGRAVYPGFIDAHCHFFGYGCSLLKADFTGTKSFDEVLDRLLAYQSKNTFPWILGGGWDQNDWPVKEFPTRAKLDSLFPDTPVLLKRIDGHAVLCNNAVLRMAGITRDTRVPGGEIILQHGQPTGLLIDNAATLAEEHVPAFSEPQFREALLRAQKLCLAAGLTTVTDAGLGKDSIFLVDRMQQEGLLKIRMVAMLSNVEATLEHFFKTGPVKTARLNVRSVKLYSDGSLGSRGACLLQPYSDAPGHRGFLLYDTAYMTALARRADAHGFQLCTHCIGDSGTRAALQVYASVLKGKNDKRWRLEHCQVVQPSDLPLFEQYSILPSVQPTHATSDMYWAGDRLGPDRLPYAYAYKDLLRAAGHIAFGTDFPIEDIRPVGTFFAAVARQDKHFFPAGGFQPENAVSRLEALKAMTIEAAFAAFEEHEKGSLEAGKVADFVVLDTDLMKAPLQELPKAGVVATYVAGERVYKK